jgi:hypothetical protein
MEKSRGIHLFSPLWERDHLEEASFDGRIVLNLIFRKWDEVLELDRSGSG